MKGLAHVPDQHHTAVALAPNLIRPPIRCLVVDDHPAVRVGPRDLLTDQPGFEVLDAVATAEAAVSFAERNELDVAIVAYQLGGRNGLWVSRKLKRLPTPPGAHVEPALREQVLEVQEAVRTSLEDVRQIALELRPEALNDLGLASALAVLCERFAQRSGMVVMQHIDEGLPELDPESELVIHRVAQEALTDVARHSGSERAELSLRSSNGLVSMTVKDSGRGVQAPLAIIDISMPRMTGLQAVRELHRRRPELRTLILSMHENERYLYEALKAGASGYVLKTVADRDLVEACRAAMRGDAFLYPGAMTTLISDYLRQARDEKTIREEPLTPREQEVVKLIAESYSTRQIADALVISEKTVDRHRANILEKLRMHDRVALTR